MKIFKSSQSSSIRFRKGSADHWKDADELHKVLHSLPGYFRAVLLDLIDNPMALEDIMTVIKNMEMRMSRHQKRKFQKTDVHKDIDFAIKCGVIELKNGTYMLTPGGLEIAQHMKEVIPLFFNTLLSTKAVSFITIIIHIFLSVVKLVFGLVSRSAGLIADAIDNTVDTISSILVWFGIKYQKVKLVSLFVIIIRCT